MNTMTTSVKKVMKTKTMATLTLMSFLTSQTTKTRENSQVNYLKITQFGIKSQSLLSNRVTIMSIMKLVIMMMTGGEMTGEVLIRRKLQLRIWIILIIIMLI